MRKLLLSAFVLLLSVTAVMAQSGEADYKAAKKSFDSFVLSNDNAKLVEAVDMIEKAMKDPMMAKDAKALVEAGEIYTAAANNYTTSRTINTADPASTEFLTPTPAVKAAKAFMKAYEVADPKKGKRARKDALKGMAALQGVLSNEGVFAIQDKKFEDSFNAFQVSLMAHKFLNDNGGESSLSPEQLNDEKYYGGLSALLVENYDGAEPLFMELYEAKYDDSAIYDGLFKIANNKGDEKMALKYLEEGRAKYPDESSLLFAEINYYLGQKKLDVLTDKLQEALDKEPDNVSLYATLGQVYEQLYNQNKEAGNDAEAQKYYDLAQSKYNEGLEKDPNAGRLIYSLGAMIYNRAAAMSQQLVELNNDFSKEGQKKYNTLKATVDEEFGKALPFFQKAEMADPNDLNTLIALKEMYARTNDFETSGEFKKRIEAIQNNEKIEKSYFVEKGM